MNTIKQLCLTGIVCLSVILTITSCSKEKAAGTDEKVTTLSTASAKLSGKEKAIYVAKKRREKFTIEGATEARKLYESLTPAEMEEFLAAKFAFEQNDLEEEVKKGVFKSNADALAFRKLQVNAVGQFRSEINKLSVEKLGKSANKLSKEEFEEIANEVNKVNKNGAYDVLGANATLARSQTTAAACTRKAYYYYCPMASVTPGIDWYGEYRYDNDYNVPVSQCDYEYAYDGTYNHIIPVTNEDFEAVGAGLSSRKPSYNDGLDTAILLGYNTKNWTVGSRPLWASMRWL